MKTKTLSALLLGACAAAAADQPPQDNAAWAKDLQDWREARAQRLSAPEGWLSLTGLEPIPAGSSGFGGAADNPIHLKGQVAAHLGVLQRDGDSIKLLPPAGGFPAGFEVDGKPARAGQALSADDDHPSRLTTGTLVFFVIHRADRYYLRIKDAQAPTRLKFQHLNWYDPDPRYRVKARWIPYRPPKTLSVASIIGTEDKMPVPGVAQFTLGGQTYRLEPVLEEPGATQLFFILHDTTSPSTSYGAGRFVYTDFPDHGLDQPGELVLDFNHLYNPPCAFTPYATCPLPPRQNWLNVALPVGEKKYRSPVEFVTKGE